MKTIITLLLLTLIVNSSFSQTLEDFFLSVPSESMMDLNEEQRQLMLVDLKSDKAPENEDFKIDNYDSKNGFIKIVGAFEGFIELCYWNLTNGDKLIAVNAVECGPICFTNQLDFYKYIKTSDGAESKIIKQDSKRILPKLYSRPLILFAEEKTTISELKPYLERDNYFRTKLPQTGKNIIVSLELSTYWEQTGINVFRGTEIELNWIDGKFEVGKIIK